eukprot:TRINITY_DN22318_c0_g1_i1.p1 TRINITY_DN22318_c0_g1~~TRINITY_DN22318_c0_g1_i1.p1  ORF type:complete len:398 (+),score=126.45 TRINITY_DN22318_c0_g1_i1:48-1196(+)
MDRPASEHESVPRSQVSGVASQTDGVVSISGRTDLAAAAAAAAAPHPLQERKVKASEAWTDSLSHVGARKPQHGEILCIKGSHNRAQLQAAQLRADDKGMRRLRAFTLSRDMHSSFTGEGRTGGFKLPQAPRFGSPRDQHLGPGCYNPTLGAALAQKGVTVRHTDMPRAARRLQGEEEAEKGAAFPGVGQYDASHLFNMARGRRARREAGKEVQTAAQAVRGLSHHCLPAGPGPQAEWAPNGGIGTGDGRQFSIAPHPPRFPAADAGSLGPGTYDADVARDLHVSKRPQTARMDMRGWCRDAHSVFTRNDLQRAQLTAGPGYYEIRSCFKPRAEPLAFFKKAADIRRRRADSARPSSCVSTARTTDGPRPPSCLRSGRPVRQ